MHTNKGYVIPVILILILLLLAGFIMFSQTEVESPVVEELPVYVATTTPEIVATSSVIIDSESLEESDVSATTTASTTLNTSATEELEE